MNARRLLRVLRRGLLVIVLATVAGAALGVVAGRLTDRTSDARKRVAHYQAVQRFGFDAVALSHAPSTELSNIDAVAELTDDPNVRSRIGEQMHGDGASLAQGVTTIVYVNQAWLDVVAVGTTPDDAVDLAKTAATALDAAYAERLAAAAADQSNQLSSRLDDLKQRRAAVEAQLGSPGLSAIDRDTLVAQRDALVNQYRIAYDQFVSLGSSPKVGAPLYTLQHPHAGPISAAEYQATLERGRAGASHLTADENTPTESAAGGMSSPIDGPVGYGVLGAILGAVLGIALVLLRDRLKQKLLTPEEFEASIGVAVVAKIPRVRGRDASRGSPTSLDEPFGPAAEAYRGIRSSVMLLSTDGVRRDGAVVVMVASALPKEGKSTTCANLAVTFAQGGRSVLAVNCDYRRPSLHQFFDLDKNDAGIVHTAVPELSVVANAAGGRMHPGTVGEYQRSLVESQRHNYDVILLDTSPLLSTSDPIDLLSCVDFVLYVGRVGMTRCTDFQAGADLLGRHRADVAGIVVVGVAENEGAYAYYYRDASMPPDRDASLPEHATVGGTNGHVNGHSNGDGASLNGTNGHANGSNGSDASKANGTNGAVPELSRIAWKADTSESTKG
jgi:Mrp family chromosome partitioning ATPase